MSSGIVVVKLGGTTLAEQKPLLAEVAKVARERPIILVHGGGKRMTEWLDRLGVQTRFEGGLRVTDPAALEVAAAVLRGVVNSELVAALRRDVRGIDPRRQWPEATTVMPKPRLSRRERRSRLSQLRGRCEGRAREVMGLDGPRGG